MSRSRNNDQNARERKRAKFSGPARRRKSLVPVFIVAVVALLVGAAILLWSVAPTAGDTAEASAADFTAPDGAVRLPLSTFDDGQVHFYTHQAEDISIEYFVLKSSDGVVRAAFNACDVCFLARQGYRQEGDEMVCNNCGQRFPSVLINEVRGGCNPAPLDRVVEGDELVIYEDDILAGIGYFE